LPYNLQALPLLCNACNVQDIRQNTYIYSEYTIKYFRKFTIQFLLFIQDENTKMDIKERGCEYVEWVHLAHDTVQ